MKAVAAIVVLVALAYGGWRLASEKGWIDQGSGLTQQLEDKQNEDFNKP